MLRVEPRSLRTLSKMKRKLGALYLRLIGWKAVGTPPAFAKYVVVAAPHTSNWDFPILLAVSWVLDVQVGFIGKHTLFKGPLGLIMRRLGGVPVDRSKPGRIVGDAVAAFAAADRLAIAIAPEGTRAAAPFWKSGFYRIAHDAEVPVVLAFIDYATKTAGVGPTVELTGNADADMAFIAEFYADKHGRRPGRFGPVRLQPAED